MVQGKVSVIIPSRNEPYLQKTIQDILKKATGDIEVVVTLDGYWPPFEEIVDDPRVTYIHFSEPRGMRNAINSAVKASNGEYIMKCDAHCAFGVSFDEILKKDCKENWIVIPRRYALDPIRWEIENNPKYPVDYMYLSNDLHGVVWDEKNKNKELENTKIDDTMSGQGSCWFMRKDYFDFLELLDEETYGTFWSEFQEIGLKCWLSEGRIVVNKNTWYAHWHKPSDVGRGYNLPKGEKEQTAIIVNRWLTTRMWHKQKHDVNWLIRKFKPVPTWQ